MSEESIWKEIVDLWDMFWNMIFNDQEKINAGLKLKLKKHDVCSSVSNKTCLPVLISGKEILDEEEIKEIILDKFKNKGINEINEIDIVIEDKNENEKEYIIKALMDPLNEEVIEKIKLIN